MQQANTKKMAIICITLVQQTTEMAVAVILEREWHDKILKVERISDSIINV